LTNGTRALVAHPPAPLPCPRGVEGPVTLAIGPEGGFTPYEVELLCAHGFTAVSLGPRPLRVEHAVPALLGRPVAFGQPPRLEGDSTAWRRRSRRSAFSVQRSAFSVQRSAFSVQRVGGWAGNAKR